MCTDFDLPPMVEDFPSLYLTTNSLVECQFRTPLACAQMYVTFPPWLGIQQVIFFPSEEPSVEYSFSFSPSEYTETWYPESFMAQWRKVAPHVGQSIGASGFGSAGGARHCQR